MSYRIKSFRLLIKGILNCVVLFNKNLPNVNEELFEVPYVVAQHIFVDMNFLIRLDLDKNITFKG